MDGKTTDFTQFIEVYFPTKVSKVGFWLNPSLGNITVAAFDTSPAFSGIATQNMIETAPNFTAGDFSGSDSLYWGHHHYGQGFQQGLHSRRLHVWERDCICRSRARHLCLNRIWARCGFGITAPPLRVVGRWAQLARFGKHSAPG